MAEKVDKTEPQPGPSRDAFARSFVEYARQMKEAAESHRGADVLSKFHARAFEASEEAYRKWVDAWRRYVDAVRDAASTGSPQPALEVYLAYLNECNGIQREFARKWDAVETGLRDELRGAGKEYTDRAAAAYANYLEETRRAWQTPEAKNLDAQGLAQIGQLLSSAAHHAWYATSCAG